MGAVRMRVQTADINIIIHTTPVYQLEAIRGNSFKLQCLKDGFVSYRHSWSLQDVGVVWIICGLLWCFWRHPFTAEVPLANKWWNAKFLQKRRVKLIFILDCLRVSTFSQSLAENIDYKYNTLNTKCIKFQMDYCWTHVVSLATG